jgi:deazaflavin-dependent oxidoreductase (nitroreductase family)
MMTGRTPGPSTIKLLRAPTRLYDWHAGWILGRRFLRLTHIGRRSERHYQTILEVIGENRTTREVIVIAGLGRSANWYRNLKAHDAVEVAISNERFAPAHRELSESEATSVLAEYERRNRLITPIIRRVLSRLIGWRYDGTDTARRELVTQLPVIGLRPAARSRPSPGRNDAAAVASPSR